MINRILTLSDLDCASREHDCLFISYTHCLGKFTLHVYDEYNKYLFDVPQLSVADINMVRRIYSNVYRQSENLPF